jgi:hypothetical protein
MPRDVRDDALEVLLTCSGLTTTPFRGVSEDFDTVVVPHYCIACGDVLLCIGH